MKIKHRHFNKAKLCSALVVLGTSALFTISCSDNILGTDEQVNIDGKAVRFHIVDGQQVALAKRAAGATRSGAPIGSSIANQAPQKLMANDGTHCLIASTLEGVNLFTQSAKTRGTIVNTTTLTPFSTSGYRGSAVSSISSIPDWFYNEKTNADGQLTKTFLWAGALPYARFYSVYPQTESYSKMSLSPNTYSGNPYVVFEVEPDVLNQKDFMTACSGQVDYDGHNAPTTNLEFQHALTAVKFSTGRNLSPITITKVEITGAITKGKYTLSDQYATAGSWDLTGYESERHTVSLDGISVNALERPNTVLVGKGTDTNPGADNYTFFMIPQLLTGKGVVANIYYNKKDGTPSTLPIKITLKGSWLPGTTTEYKLTQKNSDWEYQLSVTDPSEFTCDGTSSKTTYEISSYRNVLVGYNYIQQPVAWKAVSYQEWDYATNDWGPQSTTKPSWLTTFDKTEGECGVTAWGTITNDQGNVAVRRDVRDLMNTYYKVLKDATPKGQGGAPFNLANPLHGETSSDITESANSYLISAPGRYRIPLVYGNAIINNTTNSSSYANTAQPVQNSRYLVLNHFVDHNDVAISHALINEQNNTSPANSAKIIWSDYPNLVHFESNPIKSYPVTIDGTTKNVDFVEFTVTKDDIKNGNAVIAVKHGNTIMWSWHLWFAESNSLDKIRCVNQKGDVIYFTRSTLGYVLSKWYEATYSKPRKVKIMIAQQAGNGSQSNWETKPLIITQDAGTDKQGQAPLYRFGIKDAYPGTDLFYLSGSSTASSEYPFVMNKGLAKPTFGDLIKNPDKYYMIPYDTFSTNLWSAENGYDGFHSYESSPIPAIIKTIYDPCPAGFHVPKGNAFTGFIKTGMYESMGGEENVNKVGAYDYGIHFKSNDSANPTIYFPALSNRDWTFKFNSYDLGKGYYHTAEFGYWNSFDGPRYFYFDKEWRIENSKRSSTNSTNAFAVRPASDNP